MSIAERPYHHGDLRRSLIELASALLGAGGAEAISLRRIASQAGVSHTAAYTHFPTKQALIAAVLSDGYVKLADQIEAKVNGETRSLEQLIEIAAIYYAYSRKHPKLFLAMSGPRVNESGDYPDLEAALACAYGFVKRPFAEAPGPLPLGEATAPAFWASLQGLLVQILTGRVRVRPSEGDRFVADYTRALCKGLGLDEQS